MLPSIAVEYYPNELLVQYRKHAAGPAVQWRNRRYTFAAPLTASYNTRRRRQDRGARRRPPASVDLGPQRETGRRPIGIETNKKPAPNNTVASRTSGSRSFGVEPTRRSDIHRRSRAAISDD